MGARIGLGALPRGVAIVVVAVVVLNLFDIVLTLQHLERGAVELNPLMRHLLDEGWLAFAAAKHLGVSAGVFAAAWQYRRRLVFGALRFVVLPAYGATAVYHVVLFDLP